ncbi:MAG: RidA family protein [Burkholderiaceae bacterium]
MSPNTASIIEVLHAQGLALPTQCTPRGNFLPYSKTGKLVFMAGQINEWNGQVPYCGPVLSEAQATLTENSGLSLIEGRQAAQICALNLLFHLRDACDGELGRVRSVIRLGGFVQCLPGFDQSPTVINGASDLLIDLFGTAGRHARTAVGVSGLPANAAVEVDAVFEID